MGHPVVILSAVAAKPILGVCQGVSYWPEKPKFYFIEIHLPSLCYSLPCVRGRRAKSAWAILGQFGIIVSLAVFSQ